MKTFPLKKKVLLNNTIDSFLENYNNYTEIPILPHPGAFSCVRRHHQHEGIDLYANDGDQVLSIENGIVIDIFPFTGEHVGTSWWNNTWAILIESEIGVINYGEVIPINTLKIGDKIKSGEVIGNIRTVLRKDKGRPMSMLHLELYESGTKKAISSWNLDQEKPIELKDPTNLLLEIAKQNNLLETEKINKKKFVRS